jgi:Flp pilus assembly pilin Flp
MEEQMWKEERDRNDNYKQDRGRQTRRMLADEHGMSTVEIILILVVLIALVIIFKSQITALVSNIFASINKSASTIY